MQRLAVVRIQPLVHFRRMVLRQNRAHGSLPEFDPRRPLESDPVPARTESPRGPFQRAITPASAQTCNPYVRISNSTLIGADCGRFLARRTSALCAPREWTTAVPPTAGSGTACLESMFGAVRLRDGPRFSRQTARNTESLVHVGHRCLSGTEARGSRIGVFAWGPPDPRITSPSVNDALAIRRRSQTSGFAPRARSTLRRRGKKCELNDRMA